jgi:hypothetical protein
MHTETVKLGPIPVGIAPVLANVISKSPRMHCEESQTERPEPKQHLKRRQRRRHSHHGHHKYRIDRSRIGEDCSSRRTSRQKPVDVFARNGVRHQQRRNHLSQARRRREQNWSSNRYLSRREYRHESGSSQTKKSGAGFLYRLWEFCSFIMGGCVGKSRRVKPLDNLAERPGRTEE